jgi:hypothetical protein
MKASILDMRRRMGDILRALEQNEPVTILHRGREKGIIYPSRTSHLPTPMVREHPAFGMWKDRENMREVDRIVRKLRKGRSHGI